MPVNQNAKKEFLEATEGKTVVSAYISECHYSIKKPKTFKLKKGYTIEELETFLNEIDFTYDSGYGSQYLDGIIWLKNNSWLERDEYDGSEWWTLKQCPKITKELK